MTDSMPPPPQDQQPVGGPPAGVPAASPMGKRRNKWLILLLSIVTFGIWTIVWSYQNGEELKKYNNTGLGGVAYLFVTILISPVTMFLMAGEVEQMYKREGRVAPISTIWGLWFLLPLIGNLIWYFRIQNAINEFWQTHGDHSSPGI